MAVAWALLTKPSISAPLKFLVRVANSVRYTSVESLSFSLITLVWIIILRICKRPGSSWSPETNPNKIINCKIVNIFLTIYLSNVLGAVMTHFIETVLLSTHKICCVWEIKNLILHYTLYWEFVSAQAHREAPKQTQTKLLIVNFFLTIYLSKCFG